LLVDNHMMRLHVQVVSHNVPEQTLRDMDAACEEFFRLPMGDKAASTSMPPCRNINDPSPHLAMETKHTELHCE
jgi:hypothetical protein